MGFRIENAWPVSYQVKCFLIVSWCCVRAPTMVQAERMLRMDQLPQSGGKGQTRRGTRAADDGSSWAFCASACMLH
ncbi:hypothetical protein BC567DRAFT_64858 [Phyllosticta citribraziliensis]